MSIEITPKYLVQFFPEAQDQRNVKSGPFASLDKGLQARIFSCVDLEDFPSVSRVCHRFHDLVFKEGLKGENYKTFLIKFHIYRDFTELFEANQGLLAQCRRPWTHDERSRVFKAGLTKALEDLDELYRTQFSSSELLELAKIRSPELRRLNEKLDFFISEITPILQGALQAAKQSQSKGLMTISKTQTNADSGEWENINLKTIGKEKDKTRLIRFHIYHDFKELFQTFSESMQLTRDEYSRAFKAGLTKALDGLDKPYRTQFSLSELKNLAKLRVNPFLKQLKSKEGSNSFFIKATCILQEALHEALPSQSKLPGSFIAELYNRSR